MKQYLIDLIEFDLKRQNILLTACTGILLEVPDNIYWKGRLTAQMNKIMKIEKYLERIKANEKI